MSSYSQPVPGFAGSRYRTLSRPGAGPPSIARWTALCAAAEAIGMTAAATAAKTSQALVGEPTDGREAAIALSLVVGGGLVEGLALGGLQAAGLRRWLPELDRRRWLLVTTAVAGVGWALASVPAVMSAPGDDSAPPWLLVTVGAMALGAVMGSLLGAVQATGLRGHVRHPWRWVTANAAAWAPAMTVIFLGASTPGSDWSGPSVAALGTATGLVAGACLGLVTGWFLPSLDGSPAQNRVVLWVLGSAAHRALDHAVVGLRVRGSVSGRTFELPVQYAEDGDGLVVVPGRPQGKTWWRNLEQPAPVELVLRGRRLHGRAQVLRYGEPGYASAIDAYRARWPRARLTEDNLVVRVHLLP